MFHVHKWSKWAPLDHYLDTSYGGETLSTTLLRKCRCGDVRSKGLYGVVLTLSDERPGGDA